MNLKKIFINIKGLLTDPENNEAPLTGQNLTKSIMIHNAFLFVEGDKIIDYGTMDRHDLPIADDTVDCQGKFIIPGFCDSHTHIVFADTRQGEFVDRIKGLSYEEIASNGGGILNSASKMALADESFLVDYGQQRIEEVKSTGTVALEIKSGYALTLEGEIKMLKVIRKLKENNPQVVIKSTFLGAHAIPLEFRSNRDGYVNLVIEKMIPKIASEGLADYCDVFCEKGFFTPEETIKILEAGKKYGLKPKVHANELARSGGVQAGINCGAISVDHLECLGAEELTLLKLNKTIATLLPGTAFFLGIEYADARTLINENITIALASDYNPGTTPSGNMPFVVSLASIAMKMLPIEALNASTYNGSFAMEVNKELGSIKKGKIASFIITKKIPDLNFLAYNYGSSWIDSVYFHGNI